MHHHDFAYRLITGIDPDVPALRRDTETEYFVRIAREIALEERRERNDLYVDLGKAEAVMPGKEQVPAEASMESRRSAFIRTPIAMPMAASTAMRIRTLANTPIITNMASPAIWITAPAPPAPMRRV